MSRKFSKDVRPAKERMPDFAELPTARQRNLTVLAEAIGLGDSAPLHDAWMETLRQHEALRWRESQSMAAVAKSEADQRSVEAFCNSLSHTASMLANLSAIEEREFFERLKEDAKSAGSPPREIETIEANAQQALTSISNLSRWLASSALTQSRALRVSGRPKILSRHTTVARLLTSWIDAGLALPRAGTKLPPLIRFFDEITSGVELRFYAGWTAHDLSSRWHRSDKQVMFSVQEFSKELPRLRALLSKLARVPNSQKPPDI